MCEAILLNLVGSALVRNLVQVNEDYREGEKHNIEL